ncbi:MAG: SDR family NAD(P)-dependent oxidoreductase [Pseudomonadota bacterium]
MARHVLISGGGTGIGATLARSFASEGYSVSVLGRRLEPLQEVAQETNGLAIQCDVTDRTAIDEALAKATEVFGYPSVVIANAGNTPSSPFDETSTEEFDQTFAVNVGGTFHLWQAALPRLKAEGQGRLIAIASTAGLQGYPYVAPYCAAKHAVIGLVRALARELSPTFITVNAICPGFIETPRFMNGPEALGEDLEPQVPGTPQNQFISTEEVAAAAIYLASEGAAAVNGHTLTLSRGAM